MHSVLQQCNIYTYVSMYVAMYVCVTYHNEDTSDGTTTSEGCLTKIKIYCFQLHYENFKLILMMMIKMMMILQRRVHELFLASAGRTLIGNQRPPTRLSLSADHIMMMVVMMMIKMIMIC